MILNPQGLLTLLLNGLPLTFRRLLRVPLHLIPCRRPLILVARDRAPIRNRGLHASGIW